MSKLLVLGEHARLKARTATISIEKLGLPNQPLPQFLIFMLYGLILAILDLLLRLQLENTNVFKQIFLYSV
jgi:hypothetical protein